MQKSAAKSRFSSDEFCHLIESHLQKLETCLDTQPQYGRVLEALRQNLEDYKRTKLAVKR